MLASGFALQASDRDKTPRQVARNYKKALGFLSSACSEVKSDFFLFTAESAEKNN
jgi:hypothetical protein